MFLYELKPLKECFAELLSHAPLLQFKRNEFGNEVKHLSCETDTTNDNKSEWWLSMANCVSSWKVIPGGTRWPLCDPPTPGVTRWTVCSLPVCVLRCFFSCAVSMNLWWHRSHSGKDLPGIQLWKNIYCILITHIHNHSWTTGGNSSLLTVRAFTSYQYQVLVKKSSYQYKVLVEHPLPPVWITGGTPFTSNSTGGRAPTSTITGCNSSPVCTL